MTSPSSNLAELIQCRRQVEYLATHRLNQVERGLLRRIFLPTVYVFESEDGNFRRPVYRGRNGGFFYIQSNGQRRRVKLETPPLRLVRPDDEFAETPFLRLFFPELFEAEESELPNLEELTLLSQEQLESELAECRSQLEFQMSRYSRTEVEERAQREHFRPTEYMMATSGSSFGKTIYRGPRGGFFFQENGKKRYLKEGDPRIVANTVEEVLEESEEEELPQPVRVSTTVQESRAEAVLDESSPPGLNPRAPIFVPRQS